MTHEKTKHLCDFCNREYASEANAAKHEGRCYNDPKNRACVTCKHFTHDFVEKHYLEGGEDVERIEHETACLIDKDYEETGYGRSYNCLKSNCDWWEGKTIMTRILATGTKVLAFTRFGAVQVTVQGRNIYPDGQSTCLISVLPEHEPQGATFPSFGAKYRLDAKDSEVVEE